VHPAKMLRSLLCVAVSASSLPDYFIEEIFWPKHCVHQQL
jgi:hypothetical protein